MIPLNVWFSYIPFYFVKYVLLSCCDSLLPVFVSLSTILFDLIIRCCSVFAFWIFGLWLIVLLFAFCSFNCLPHCVCILVLTIFTYLHHYVILSQLCKKNKNKKTSQIEVIQRLKQNVQDWKYFQWVWRPMSCVGPALKHNTGPEAWVGLDVSRNKINSLHRHSESSRTLCLTVAEKCFSFTRLETLKFYFWCYFPSVEMSDVRNSSNASLMRCTARQRSSISLSVEFVGAARWWPCVITVLFGLSVCQEKRK